MNEDPDFLARSYNKNVLSYMDVDLCQNSLKCTLRVKHFTVCKFNLDLTLLL